MRRTLLLTLLLAAAMPGFAAEDGQFAVRGFGTAGVSCYSSNTRDFDRDERPYGPGKTQRCDAGLDSVLGVQVDAQLHDQVEGTLQAVSYHRADDTYAPELTQANARWALGEDFTVRAGRMQNPLFFVSEYRNVLFAQPWARPPVEVYNVATAYSVDGVQANKRINLDAWSLNLEGGMVGSRFDVTRTDGSMETDPVKVRFAFMDFRLEQENWRLMGSLLGGRVSYSQPDFDAVLDALHSNGFGDLANDLAMDDKSIVMLGLGAAYESNDWLFQGEAIYRHIDSVYQDKFGAYLMAGRRLGEWMPYAILALQRSQYNGPENTVPQDPANPANPVNFLHAAVNGMIASTAGGNQSVALGVSRKLGKQADVKFQADWIRPESVSHVGRDVEHLLTLNVDFIF